MDMPDLWIKELKVIMKTREARCSCERVKIITPAQPIRVSVCHCLDCQRRTGSVFGAQARFDEKSVVIEGCTNIYTRKADSGNNIHFHFCPHCGSTVYYSIEVLPGYLVVPVGAFADPDFPQPEMSIYEERIHGWYDFTCQIAHID